MGQDNSALMALMAHAETLSAPSRRRALQVVEDRLARGGPYRTTPMEDYLRVLEDELKEKIKQNDQLMDRVVHLEDVCNAWRPGNEIRVLNGVMLLMTFGAGVLLALLLAWMV